MRPAITGRKSGSGRRTAAACHRSRAPARARREIGGVAAATPPGEEKLAHEERVQLVAVEIAEVAGVEARAARAGRAFVLAAEGERFLVEGVHLLLARGGERDHDAVPDR